MRNGLFFLWLQWRSLGCKNTPPRVSFSIDGQKHNAKEQVRVCVSTTSLTTPSQEAYQPKKRYPGRVVVGGFDACMSRYERNPKRPTHDRRSLSPPPLSPRCWGEPSNQHHHAHPHLDRFQKHEDRDYISQNRRERHHHHRSDHRMIRGRSFSPSEEESHHPVKRSRKRSFSDRSRSRSYSRGRQEYSISRTETSRHDDRRQNSRRRRRTSRRNGKRRERSSEDARHYSNHSRRHQEHKQQFPRHMDIPPSAGIVSDDDEHAENTVARQRSKSPGNNGRHHNKRNFDPNRSPSSHDDTVGHFQGGPGTIVADRYRIARQVGLGTFGKVMECLDLHSRNRRPSYVAMKIVRSVKRYCSSAKIEADIIRQINHRGGRGITHCVVLHDAFSYFDHYCLVFEQLGPSLYDFLKKHEYRPFPMICIQDFAVQLLEAMEFLHSFGLCHCDLKVENILLMNDREVTYRKQRVPESTRIKLIDFGGTSGLVQLVRPFVFFAYH